jgi:large subunit ribosomal protein L6
MSRIGRQPIAIPEGVDVVINDGTVEIKGPKGALTQDLPRGITVEHDEAGKSIVVKKNADTHSIRALHGLTRALLNNMVVGVTAGFTKALEVIGVGYGAKVQGGNLVLSVGLTNPVPLPIPQGLQVAEPTTTNVAIPGVGSVPVTTIVITGVDKREVGQFAAAVRAARPPEPYKGKGIRYKGEEVRRKAGKAMAGVE